MVKLTLYAALAAAFASSITALPATATTKTTAKTTSTKVASTTTKASSTIKAATACTFTNAASAIASKRSCTSIVINAMSVPAGTTLDLTGLNAGTTVTFQGNTSFGYAEWVGPLISISGTNIHVIGAAGSVLDGLGSYYWDGQGSNGGKTKPKFFAVHDLVSSSIANVKIANAPVQVFSIDGANGLTMTGITVDNSAGAALGHNTDAFDIGESEGVYISGANVINQDDCLAMNSGSNITFTSGTCTGGHGLSIGSVGGRSSNTVSNVTISSSSISIFQNGVRIKTVSGATGSVTGVTYKDITLSNISKYGIVIEQDYENGSPTGTPTTDLPITGLTLDGVTGSVASGGTEVYVLCGKGACSGWTWEGVSVTGGKRSTGCENVPAPASC